MDLRRIVEVLDLEVRELSPLDYSQNQRLAFSEWLNNARTVAEIEELWSPEKAPADPFLEAQRQ